MQLLQARVQAVRVLAEGIRCFQLVAGDRAALPPYEPGAHIDVHLPSGRIRQYSLCGEVEDGSCYEIAVQLEPEGRGGSAEVFRALGPGSTVPISPPRNNFPLAVDAARHVFVAGGIGITPILSMVRVAARTAVRYKLIYCTRSPERTAFLDFASGLAAQGLALVHHDGGRRAAQVDFHAMLRDRPDGAHLYCCGPNGLMRAVREASASWPAGTVHFEYFANTEPSRPAEREMPFRIKLQKSGALLDVPADRSIVQVLRGQGIEVETSCESGLCGTCKTRYLSGMPDHRDLVLDEAEHTQYLMICCSRAKSELLVLDL